jgi:hypothetical protein
MEAPSLLMNGLRLMAGIAVSAHRAALDAGIDAIACRWHGSPAARASPTWS